MRTMRGFGPYAPTPRRPGAGGRLAVLLALLGAVWLLPAPAAAQEADARLSADEVTVGERFLLTLRATTPPDGGAAHFPDAADTTAFGDLEVIGVRARGSAAGGGVDSIVYEVTTFALDTALVPSFPVAIVREGDTLRAATPPIALPVRSLVPEGTEAPRDLAPLVDFPRSPWPWVALVAGLLALAALLWYALRRRAGGEPAPAAEPPPLPPLDEALARLRVLESADLAEPAAVKPFYVELSDTLRRYLARRVDVPALELTTRELIQALEHRRGLPPEGPARLRSILVEADMVKFADRRPPAASARARLREAHDLLVETEAALAPPPEAASATPSGTASETAPGRVPSAAD